MQWRDDKLLNAYLITKITEYMLKISYNHINTGNYSDKQIYLPPIA